jgi:transcriptional regulator of acetoin/glycerol metabolism
MSALLAYNWPGNIRQLVNALTFAEATCDNGQITASDLRDECLRDHVDTTTAGVERDVAPEKSDPLLGALKHHRWNVSAVARRYGVSRPTIYRWMQQKKIEAPRFQGKL